jgi:hypothetical protein
MKINSKGESISVDNNTSHRNKFQLELFVTEQPKILRVIHCSNCSNERELDGYVFKLVPVCADCRTESDLEILSKRIERRAKR